MKRTIQKSRIILTGASSGIGRALALAFAAEGADLVLLARRENLLQELVGEIETKFGSKVFYVAGDITDPDVRGRLVELAKEKLGSVDYLVNNAGVGATCLLEETSDEHIRQLMEVNYFSTAALTRLVLPLMKQPTDRENVKPMVVFLGSIVGLRGVPHYGAYGAAKFAVACYSETLRAELYKTGIEVLLVCPGTTKTEFFDSLLKSSGGPNLPVHSMVSSEYVAGKIVTAMKKSKHRIIPYFPAKILNVLNRLLPGLTDRIMTWYS